MSRRKNRKSVLGQEFVDRTKMHRPVILEIGFPKLILQLSLCHHRLALVRPTVRSSFPSSQGFCLQFRMLPQVPGGALSLGGPSQHSKLRQKMSTRCHSTMGLNQCNEVQLSYSNCPSINLSNQVLITGGWLEATDCTLRISYRLIFFECRFYILTQDPSVFILVEIWVLLCSSWHYLASYGDSPWRDEWITTWCGDTVEYYSIIKKE